MPSKDRQLRASGLLRGAAIKATQGILGLQTAQHNEAWAPAWKQAPEAAAGQQRQGRPSLWRPQCALIHTALEKRDFQGVRPAYQCDRYGWLRALASLSAG